MTDFFDFRAKAMHPPTEPDESKQARAISVGDLTARIDAALKQGLPASLLVRGEISNANHHAASGHLYFTLKDGKSCIDCVMFRGDVQRLRSIPRDGAEVLATGGVKIYAQRGRYQFYCTNLMALGVGALEEKFRLLREKLEREGLFEISRKRQIPRFPLRIALVTSKQAAGLADMLKVFARTPWLKIDVRHVPVQGDGAAAKIAEAIRGLKASQYDLAIVGRGGGSLEDLWEFNEEVVARAVFAAAVPVMTGIGHEVDVSIADLVADYHAHTPTEAAQVAVAGWRQAADYVETAALRLRRGLAQQIDLSRQRLRNIERHEAFRRPLDRIDRLRQLLDDRQRQLGMALADRLSSAQRRVARLEQRLRAFHPTVRVAVQRQRLERLSLSLQHRSLTRVATARGDLEAMNAGLQALNPLGVLRRGYSMTTRKDGSIVKSIQDVKRGDVLTTRVGDGSIESLARDPNQPELF